MNNSHDFFWSGNEVNDDGREGLWSSNIFLEMSFFLQMITPNFYTCTSHWYFKVVWKGEPTQYFDQTKANIKKEKT